MPETPQAERPTPETDAVWNTLDISDRARLSIKRLAVRSRDIERDRDQWRESSAGCASDLEQCREERDALAERVKEAERGEITWQDDNIPRLAHSITTKQAREILKAYFDEWPDGLDEIASSISQFKKRADLAESRLAALTEVAKRLVEAWKKVRSGQWTSGPYIEQGDAACAEIDAAQSREGA